jgi:hypothetical protein
MGLLCMLQAHEAMNMLEINLRQEHWETLSYGSTCVQLLTPWQMATFFVESYTQWYDERCPSPAS